METDFILKNFVEKYGGEYHIETAKFAHTPWGKLHSQPESGVLVYENRRIILGGNNTSAEEFLRMRIKVENKIPKDFLLLPKSFWQSVFSFLAPNWKYNFPTQIHKYHKFTGKPEYIQAMRGNQNLLDLLAPTRVAVSIPSNNPNYLQLIPVHGYGSIEDLELFASILVAILDTIEKVDSSYH